MNKNQQPAVALFGVGLLGLGVLAVHYRDFALVWQPVPAWVPAHAAAAFATGALMIALGIALLIPRARAWSVRILFPYLILWATLKLPDVILAPGTEASWLGLGELTLLLSGGWALFATLGDVQPDSGLGFLAGERGLRASRYLFALSIIPIGLSHLVYLSVTAGYVPHWLPFRRDWAILTGAGQIASGLGVLFNVVPRFAAYAEAAQIMIYTFLVWAAAFLAANTRLNITAFFVSWIFGAAAWAVAQNIPAKSPTRAAAVSADGSSRELRRQAPAS